MNTRRMSFIGACIAVSLLAAVCGNGNEGGAGTFILSVCYKDDTVPDSGEIYLAKNGAWEMIVPDGAYPENVELSADGSLIAYSKGKDTAAEIFVMDLHTRTETRVTNNSWQDYNPNLSPDGQEVVYWSGRGGDIQLYISSTDGTGERNIINDPDVYTFDPEWSHDGSMIAFNYDTTKTGCKAVIWAGILNSEHTGFDHLFPVSNTAGAYVEVDPAWSPDDSRIVFSTYEGPGCWHTEGLLSENLDQWKMKTVTVDRAGMTGSGMSTVWAGDGTSVNWLPIWAGQDRLLFIHSVVDGSANRPFGTTSHLSLYDIAGAEETSVPGSEGCYWCDCQRRKR